MKFRIFKASAVGLLGVMGWLMVNVQPARGQVIAVAAGVWGWRNIVAPQIGGPWIAPEVRFRPFGLLPVGRRYEALPAPKGSAQIIVTVPDANAQVWVEGRLMSAMGKERTFVSPPLQPGITYRYEIRARWGDEQETVERTRRVPIRMGERVQVDFSRPPSPSK
jgi:uncharacterized protein (TIGR03000 family)